VVCRDRLAEFVCWAAITACSLDRISTEVRNLQRTEILEVAEGFEARLQVGSSTMPHKQNPVECEKISGLAKVMRGMVIPALENIPLWHERDLTDSSSERFVLPLSFIILDEMLITSCKVLKNLRIFPLHMKVNLGMTKGAILTEAVMMALARKGMGRQEAHDALRKASEKAFTEGLPMSEVIARIPEVTKLLSKVELKKLLDPNNYIGKSGDLIDRAVKYAKST
jgi:adenylosuccinate lyase